MNARRGYTLIEMLVVVLIIATLAALSMDLLRPRDEERIEGAVRMFTQDVEWARSATLNNPDDPAAIRLAEDGSGWFIARNSTPTVAMTAADGSTMRRTLGQGMSQAAAGVRLVSSSSSQTKIEFEPFGGVREGPASVTAFLPDSNRSCLITFTPDTGSITVNWPN